jgi:hypothetical protein
MLSQLLNYVKVLKPFDQKAVNNWDPSIANAQGRSDIAITQGFYTHLRERKEHESIRKLEDYAQMAFSLLERAEI